MRMLMLVFVLVLVSGPGAVFGESGSSAHAHERSGERTVAQACMPAGHSPIQHASSCSSGGVAILAGSLSFDVSVQHRHAPLFAEVLYLSLAVDRLERPPAAYPA